MAWQCRPQPPRHRSQARPKSVCLPERAIHGKRLSCIQAGAPLPRPGSVGIGRCHVAAPQWKEAGSGINRPDIRIKLYFRLMRLLIVGGRRFIGAELVRQALAQGHEATILSLDDPGTRGKARWIKANRESPLSQTFSHLTFDAAIDNIAFCAEHVTSLVSALRGKINRYVLTSSVDIYCNRIAKYCDEAADEHLSPSTESANVTRWEAYLRGKRACELALRNSLDIEAVVVRPAVVIGPRDNVMCPRGGAVSRSLFFPLRIADRGPVLLRHADTRLYQLAYVGDVASLLLLAATQPAFAGRVLNAVGDEVWTNERLIRQLSHAIGYDTDIVRVTRPELEAGGLGDYRTAYFRSAIHTWSLFSNARAKALGWRPTPASVWAPTLFSFTDALRTSLAGQRQKELALATKLSSRRSSNADANLPGAFHKSDQSLSGIGIGTYQGTASPEDDRAYARAIKYAVRGGINLIDTAINYRSMRSERVVGGAIRALVREGIARSALCIVSKGGFIPKSMLDCGVLTEAEIERKHSITAQYIALSLQQSIRNTRLTTIDLYLLHNPEIGIEHLGETRFYDTLIKTFAMLEQKVCEGLIGRYGIATWNALRVPRGNPRHIDLERVIRCAELAAGGKSHFAAVELPFNCRASEAASVLSQTRDNRLVSALDLAAARGLLVLASRGVIFGACDPKKALQFIQRYKQVRCVLIGMRQIAHVAEALSAMTAVIESGGG